MKIILRDLLTGLYYGGNTTWCAGVSGAVAFASIKAAASAAQDHKLESVDVVLRYEDPTCELTLPLASCIFEVPGAGNRSRPLRPPA